MPGWSAHIKTHELCVCTKSCHGSVIYHDPSFVGRLASTKRLPNCLSNWGINETTVNPPSNDINESTTGGTVPNGNDTRPEEVMFNFSWRLTSLDSRGVPSISSIHWKFWQRLNIQDSHPLPRGVGVLDGFGFVGTVPKWRRIFFDINFPSWLVESVSNLDIAGRHK